MLHTWLLLFACTSKESDSGLNSEKDTGTEAVDAEELSWEVVEAGLSQGVLMSIWESDDGTLWMVGGQFDQGVVLRENGDSFEEVALPEETPLLNWIHGESSEDFWVGGLSGTILHWDGANWQDYSVEMDEAIWGIHQAGSSVFCVGGESRWGGEEAKIFYLENEQFTEMSLPSEYENLGNLFKIGHWNEQFWAIGAAGSLISITGGVPVAVPTGISADLVTIHQDQIVGGRGVGLITSLENDGLADPVQIPAGLNGVIQYETGHSIIVGERGYGALYDASTQEYQEILSVTLDVLHAVWVDQEGDAYAVGGNLFTTDEYFHGIILKLEGVK